MTRTPQPHSHTGPGDGGGLNLIRAELIAEGQETLTQGSTTDVSVGAEVSDHLLVAYGFETAPPEDQIVQHQVFWDQSATEQKVRFEVDSASSNPTINYSVYVITDTQS